jgi:mono/diheme cytochrome c family protein
MIRTIRQSILPALLLFVTASLAAAGCGDEAASLVMPAVDTTASPGTTGASMYRYYCAGCHGLDGRPVIANAGDLRDYTAPLDSFDLILDDGPGLMPRYPQLDSARRALVYQHMRTFKR